MDGELKRLEELKRKHKISMSFKIHNDAPPERIAYVEREIGVRLRGIRSYTRPRWVYWQD